MGKGTRTMAGERRAGYTNWFVSPTAPYPKKLFHSSLQVRRALWSRPRVGCQASEFLNVSWVDHGAGQSWHFLQTKWEWEQLSSDCLRPVPDSLYRLCQFLLSMLMLPVLIPRTASPSGADLSFLHSLSLQRAPSRSEPVKAGL